MHTCALWMELGRTKDEEECTKKKRMRRMGRRTGGDEYEDRRKGSRKRELIHIALLVPTPWKCQRPVEGGEGGEGQ